MPLICRVEGSNLRHVLREAFWAHSPRGRREKYPEWSTWGHEWGGEEAWVFGKDLLVGLSYQGDDTVAWDIRRVTPIECQSPWIDQAHCKCDTCRGDFRSVPQGPVLIEGEASDFPTARIDVLRVLNSGEVEAIEARAVIEGWVW